MGLGLAGREEIQAGQQWEEHTVETTDWEGPHREWDSETGRWGSHPIGLISQGGLVGPQKQGETIKGEGTAQWPRPEYLTP